MWSHRLNRNLGQIDQNSHGHVFDDVICKPPIERLRNLNAIDDDNIDFRSFQKLLHSVKVVDLLAQKL